MRDTTQEMRKKQIEIIMSKSPQERVLMGYDIINFGYKTVKNSIMAKHPQLSEGELAVELFKRYYAHEFSPEKLNEIIVSMRAFFDKKTV